VELLQVHQPGWRTLSLGVEGLAGGRAMPDVAMLADPATGVALYTDGAWSAYQWGGTNLAKRGSAPWP
jgi:subtilase family serine protease